MWNTLLKGTPPPGIEPGTFSSEELRATTALSMRTIEQGTSHMVKLSWFVHFQQDIQDYWIWIAIDRHDDDDDDDDDDDVTMFL